MGRSTTLVANGVAADYGQERLNYGQQKLTRGMDIRLNYGQRVSGLWTADPEIIGSGPRVYGQ